MSLLDPDARPIRKGKLGKPNEFGYVSQLAEVTENTKRGARGLILPGRDRSSGNPAENTLLPGTVAELEAARDLTRARSRSTAGSTPARPNTALEDLDARAGVHRWPPATRLQAHPTPLAALPNRRRRPDQSPQTPLRAGPSRLKGDQGRQIWTGWAILAYNADTLAVRAR